MGLLVRLRHALGERVLELPDRTVDDPLVVGRAADADVQIPSINVAPRQVVLFVHDGHWVVQSAPGSTGTLVNGAALSGARALRGGDVLTLGSETNAPTIQIDPSGIPADEPEEPAHVSAPASGHGHAPAAPPRRVQAAPPVPQAGGYGPPAQAGYPPAAQEAPLQEPPPSGDDATAWMTSAVPVPSQTYYTPKRRKSSDAAVAFAVVASLAIVGGAVAFVYLKKKDAQPKQVTVVPPVVMAAPKTDEVEEGPRRPVPPGIFDDKPKAPAVKPVVPPPPPDPTDQLDEPPPPPRRNARPVVTTRGSTPRPAVTNPRAPVPENKFTEPMEEDPADPAAVKALKDWKSVESAYYNPNVAKALLAIDAYADAHPRSRGQQIDQFREDLLDKLWWDRVADLLQRRKELTEGIKKTEQAIKDETEDAFKKTVLEPRLEDQRARVARTTDKLVKEMKYTLSTPPPLNRDSEMRKLREQRDAATFKEWKTKVLLHIRQNHGAYPWVNER